MQMGTSLNIMHWRQVCCLVQIRKYEDVIRWLTSATIRSDKFIIKIKNSYLSEIQKMSMVSEFNEIPKTYTVYIDLCKIFETQKS